MDDSSPRNVLQQDRSLFFIFIFFAYYGTFMILCLNESPTQTENLKRAKEVKRYEELIWDMIHSWTLNIIRQITDHNVRVLNNKAH